MRTPLAATSRRMKALRVLPYFSTMRTTARRRKRVPLVPATTRPLVVWFRLPFTLRTSDSDFAHTFVTL